jgi:hypothetical protein
MPAIDACLAYPVSPPCTGSRAPTKGQHPPAQVPASVPPYRCAARTQQTCTSQLILVLMSHYGRLLHATIHSQAQPHTACDSTQTLSRAACCCSSSHQHGLQQHVSAPPAVAMHTSKAAHSGRVTKSQNPCAMLDPGPGTIPTSTAVATTANTRPHSTLARRPCTHDMWVSQAGASDNRRRLLPSHGSYVFSWHSWLQTETAGSMCYHRTTGSHRSYRCAVAQPTAHHTGGVHQACDCMARGPQHLPYRQSSMQRRSCTPTACMPQCGWDGRCTCPGLTPRLMCQCCGYMQSLHVASREICHNSSLAAGVDNMRTCWDANSQPDMPRPAACWLLWPLLRRTSSHTATTGHTSDLVHHTTPPTAASSRATPRCRRPKPPPHHACSHGQAYTGGSQR